MASKQEALDEIEAIIKMIAPADIRNRSIYLIRWQDIRGAGLLPIMPTAFYEFSSPTFDLDMRPIIEQLGLWRGRGFCCLYNLYFINLFDGSFRTEILHHFAHWLAAPGFDAIAGEFELRESGFSPQRPIPLEEQNGKMRRHLHLHDANFFRAACHLAHRVNSLWGRCEPSWIYGNPLFHDTRNLIWYERTLKSEVRERMGESIREILASEPPSEYREIWRRTNGGRYPKKLPPSNPFLRNDKEFREMLRNEGELPSDEIPSLKPTTQLGEVR